MTLPNSFTKAVRDHCLDCCGGSSKEVTVCHSWRSCALWPFRFGMSPRRAQQKGKLVDASKAVCACLERPGRCDLLPHDEKT